MKVLYRTLILILAACLFTACSPNPPPAAFTPIPPVEQPTQMLPPSIVIPATQLPSATDTSQMPPSIPPTTGDVSQYAPQVGDSAMMRGDLRIESSSLSLDASWPPQVTLDMAYFQPTPCFQLRVEAAKPDAQGRIQVSAYAVAEKDKACVLMALATPYKISLNLGSFPKGHYSLWLNGAKVGEFDS